ncbi:hypothetical protein Tco_0666731 [Tanacetum coccineum]
MSTPRFAETHNLVAFLEKPEKSNGFDGIIDFLNAIPIKYALTVNPTVYESYIQQFWATSKAKTVNRERQIQALVDKKKVIITEKSVRSDLMLEDAEGIECLPNDKEYKRKQRKDSGLTEPIPDEATNEEPISTPSCDPPQSGEDRLQLTELKNLCTILQKQVLNLEEAKTLKAKEICLFKERVKYDEEMLFDVQDDLQGKEVVAEKEVAKKEVSVADPVTTTGKVVTTASATTSIDELTLAQTLIEIKAAKPKAVTTATTTITTIVTSTRPKAKRIVFHDQEEQASAFKPIVSLSQLPQAKDKGKGKMVEPEKPLKKKDQIAFDEELALKLHVEEQEELEKERVTQEEDSRAANIEELNSIKAMIKADEQLAARLQDEEQEQFSIEEKSRMLVEMIAERKKFFAAQRAVEQRSKPPTKT